MSERVEQRLVALLDHPHHDPYGNPIPGLGDLGEAPLAEEPAPVRNLLEAASQPSPAERDAPLTLRRIGEPLQVDVELLARLAEAGVRPGAELLVQRGTQVVSVRARTSHLVLDLPDDVARHLFVDA